MLQMVGRELGELEGKSFNIMPTSFVCTTTAPCADTSQQVHEFNRCTTAGRMPCVVTAAAATAVTTFDAPALLFVEPVCVCQCESVCVCQCVLLRLLMPLLLFFGCYLSLLLFCCLVCR